ncbi:MAG TPA: hypothetical protein VJA94_12480 [Candidatus Angelobacter sp.]
MADDAIKKLEDRLTRLEAALSQAGGAATHFPGGAVVDPAPWGGGGGGGWGWWPRPWPWPGPIGDPAPTPFMAFHRPGTVVDPAAFHRPGAVVDPAPTPFAAVAPAATAATLGRIGPIGDPPPPDVSRFSAVQLQAALHSIAAERARLDSMENLIKQQLDKAQQAEKPK